MQEDVKGQDGEEAEIRWHGPPVGLLGLVQPSVNLPEVFGEEVFVDGLPVDPDPLPDLDQVWRTAQTRGYLL